VLPRSSFASRESLAFWDICALGERCCELRRGSAGPLDSRGAMRGMLGRILSHPRLLAESAAAGVGVVGILVWGWPLLLLACCLGFASAAGLGMRDLLVPVVVTAGFLS